MTTENRPPDNDMPPQGVAEFSASDLWSSREQDDLHVPEQMPEEVVAVSQPEVRRGPMRRLMDVGAKALKSSIIYLEVLPTNGVIRYGAFGATLAATKDPFLSAGVLGASTVALEGGAAVAAADVLSSGDKKHGAITIADKILSHKKISPIVVSKDGKLLSLSERLLALYGGSVATMTAKETEEGAESRTFQERRNYGLKLATIVGGICTAQGVMYAEGLKNFDNPKVVVPLVGASAGVTYALHKLKSRVAKEGGEDNFDPRYDLSEEELDMLENELVDMVRKDSLEGEENSRDGIYSVWVPPTSRFSNIARTYEAKYFPEVKDLPPGIEENTTFLTLVDTREGGRPVVHATTISGYNPELISSNETGYSTIDDLIQMGNFTAEEFAEYYSRQNFDLSHSYSVDTNFRTGKTAATIDGLKSSDLAYLTLFQMLAREKPDDADTAIFASINQDSIDSFARVGLEWYPLMGRTDLVTSESLAGKQFFPVVIPLNAANKAMFEGLGYKVPEIDLT